jgi:arabinose-5-phosphate isomerase
MRQKKFGEKDFARYHPGGSLGERFLLRVKELMHPAREVPCFSPEKSIGEFLAVLNREQKDFGLILHPDGQFAGMVMDRDLRKGDVGSPRFLARPIKELMSAAPLTVEEEAPGTEAMRIMVENNLTALPVLDKEGCLKGFITLRDLSDQKDQRSG